MALTDFARSPILRVTLLAYVVFVAATIGFGPLRVNAALDCFTVSFGLAVLLRGWRATFDALRHPKPELTDLLIVAIVLLCAVLTPIRALRIRATLGGQMDWTGGSVLFAWLTLVQLGAMFLAVVASTPNHVSLPIRAWRAAKVPILLGLALTAFVALAGTLR
jgi:hypothetical protein